MAGEGREQKKRGRTLGQGRKYQRGKQEKRRRLAREGCYKNMFGAVRRNSQNSSSKRHKVGGCGAKPTKDRGGRTKEGRKGAVENG